MGEDRRATFSKCIIENGDSPRTIYSFRLEKIHWITGAIASIFAVLVSLVVLRGAVYASVQDVAGEEFRIQLEKFHSQAQPAIRRMVDERIAAAQERQIAACARSRLDDERAQATELRDISETLGRLDERLASIERRLDRMDRAGGTP